jgi:transketolase
VNRLGQTGETLYGHDLDAFRNRISAFGWETLLIDGHLFPEILSAFESVARDRDRPLMIIARTLKGKGISLLEDRNGWHGKVLSRGELETAKAELGSVDTTFEGGLAPPADLTPDTSTVSIDVGDPEYPPQEPVPTRKAFGNALKRIFLRFPDLVSLDGEVGNSTYAEVFKEAWPGNFFEMYIAEQNMTGAALGLSLRGKIPFVSSFAAFLTRAFDQIRMSRYSDANIKFVGSHAGVTIGEDGPSQMGLEDIAMFRTILDGAVLYPSDAVSAERLVEAAAKQRGIVYIRTTRMATPILYSADEPFPIGGCKVLRRSTADAATVVAAGITLHEGLKAFQELAKDGIRIRVIDLYSIKPIDAPALHAAAEETGLILTVEDHYAEGGIGEAVRSALAGIAAPVHSLAVRKKPVSGTPAELLGFAEISAPAIAAKIRALLGR